MEEYSPWLFGVRHTQAELLETLKTIKFTGAKKVGIEIHKSFLQEKNIQEYDQSQRVFWETVISYLKQKKIEIVFLVSDQLGRQIDAEVAKAKSPAELEQNQKFAKLVVINMTKEMILNAQREKPQAIIAGIGHVGVMRKDLNVKKEKFRIIATDQKESAIRRMILVTQDYRRFERERRKEKLAKPKQPRKRR